MDRSAIEATRALYDSHSNVHANSQQALRARNAGPSMPLKKFHNDVKRQLINEFASGKDRLLDLACGRGGDIHKWTDANIGYVLGLDLSPGEIVEATRRFQEALSKGKGFRTKVEFRQTDDVGLAQIYHDEPYDAVTCMFAAHYFFVSEGAFRQFLSNVSGALKVGGHFFGTLPDGKRILKTLNQQQKYKQPMLYLEARFPQGKHGNFGSEYICAITDTVTQGTESVEDAGSLEYLVFFTAFKAIAAEYGLRPVVHYRNPQLVDLLEAADEGAPFKHFCPSFVNSHPSLEVASALNVAFVFKKVEEWSPPPPPPAQGGAEGRPEGEGAGAPASSDGGKLEGGLGVKRTREEERGEEAKRPRGEEGGGSGASGEG